MNRKIANRKLILWGISIQLVFALFVFIFPAGIKVFSLLNDTVLLILNAATTGSKFLFGPLDGGVGEKDSIGFIWAFQSLPTIIFFSALISLLYYFKIIPLIVEFFAKVFSKTIDEYFFFFYP